jgi:PAS domain S-box-containing protein
MYLLILQYMAAATLLAVGVMHFLVWGRMRDSGTHLLFALTAIGAAANAIAEVQFYGAQFIAEFNTAFKWSNSINGLWLVGLIWFVVLYTRSWPKRGWIPVSLSVLYAAAAIANIFMPYGILYAEITGLREVILPWGERISIAHGQANPWRIATDIALAGIIVLVVDGGVRQWRRGEKRRPVYLAGAITLFVLSMLAGSLVDVGVLPTPYLFTYGYLIVALVMSYELAGEVVRASRLSEEVRANEQRWRTLFENVNLLVTSVDREGRIEYVNPHYLEVSGYELGDLLGQPFTVVIPPEQRTRYLEGFRRAMAGDLQMHADAHLTTKDGNIRAISCSSVLQRDGRGEITGLLSVGADITEQRRAEFQRDDALAKTENALKEVQELKNRLEEEVVYLQDEITAKGLFAEIVGESDALRYVLKKVEQVAPLDTTVLIEGETGVGKELIARAIHAHSPRKDRPMVKVNCAALPSTLIETELFGHEKGAFTGAHQARMGRFELADGGTLFLDEVGELPMDLQVRLLRVLQDGEFERVGGARTLETDVRVIAASNQNLKDQVDRGRFREDLFYRLHVYPITVPTLRQRVEDIPLLVESFVRRFGESHGRNIDRVPQPVLDELMKYDWPGNVRELQNVIERSVITSPGSQLQLQARLTTANARGSSPEEYRRTLQEVERDYIVQVLEICDWRIEGDRGAAKRLDLHPNTLRSRMRKLQIERPA